MGLSMYLTGERYFWGSTRKDTPYGKLKSERYLIGQWRKHPDLHGFIIERYADGIDDCQEIWLSISDLQEILIAIENEELPKTTGFFFGESSKEDKEPSKKIIMNAIKFMEESQNDREAMRSVCYQSSW